MFQQSSFQFIFSLAFLVLMSCSKGGNILPLPDDNNQTTDHSPTGVIRCKIETGVSSPISYASALHDAEEYHIESLTLLMFKESGSDFVLHDKKSLTDKVKNQVGPDYSINWEIPFEEFGVYKFLLLANEPISLPKGTSLSTLSAHLLGRVQEVDISTSLLSANGIPMTGFARQGNSDLIAVTGNTSCSVRLTRAVCRLDIRNRVSSLVISKLQMRNVPSRSYLLVAQDPAFTVAPGGSLLGSVLPNGAMPRPFDNGKDFAKSFYFFENRMPDKISALQVDVFATLNEVSVFYGIPLIKEGKGIFFQRNHRYILQLGDDSSVVDVDDWTEVVIPVTFYIIKVVGTDTDVPIAYNNGIYELSYDASAHSNQRIKLATIFKDHQYYITDISSSDSSWLSATADAESIVVNVSPNTAGKARTGYIEFWSNAYTPSEDSKAIHKLKITQQ